LLSFRFTFRFSFRKYIVSLFAIPNVFENIFLKNKKVSHLCRMRKQFASHIEALYDLREFLHQKHVSGKLPGGIPKDVQQAVYQAEGMVPGKRKDGSVYALRVGKDRVWRLIEKYAPDRYGRKDVFYRK
jgi:hypothetical protein